MGRHDFTALRVYDTASLMLKTKPKTLRPPWYKVMTDYPPSQAFVRPQAVLHSETSATTKSGKLRKYKKPSKMFMPQTVSYEEDRLRRDFFQDHPWELARPRMVLENDGKDYQKWDWSKDYQPGRPVNGESVVQRQLHLMYTPQRKPSGSTPSAPMSKDAAYDKARKEFYELRHDEEMERRIANEEARSTGAKFGKTASEVGMQLEDEQFEKWKEWAKKEVTMAEQARSAAYSGSGIGSVSSVPKTEATLEDVAEALKPDEEDSSLS